MHTHRDPSLSTKGEEHMGGCEQQGSSKEYYRGSCSAGEQELELSQAAAIRGSSIGEGEGEGTPCKKKVRKMSKRRSRALAKPPIRVLSADKSTFRDLVLYFTGNPSPSSSSPPPPSLLPYTHPTTTYTSPSSSSPPPPPPPPSSLLAYAHPITTPPPSFPFSNPSYPHLEALLSSLTHSPLSFPNSQSHTPFSSLSSSYSTSPPPSSDGASLHSSPFPSLNTCSLDATLMQSDNKFSKVLELLQALKESLLHIKSLGECGSFNFGLLAPSNHDAIPNKGGDLKPLLRMKPDHTFKSTNTYGVDGEFFKPLLRTQVDHTPKITNTYVGDCMVDMTSLDREPLQNLRQAAELENFLLRVDEKLDDLFTSNLFHNLKSQISCDTKNHSFELADTCL